MGCENPQSEMDVIICDALEQPYDPITEEILTNTQSQLQEEREAGEKIHDTARLLGIEEWAFVIEYFGLSGANTDVVDQIESLQRQLGFSGDDVDGIIGPTTLQRIYESEYSQHLSEVGELQRRRWQAHLEMRDYPEKRRWVGHLEDTVTLYPSRIPNVFSRNYYFGEVDGFPQTGTAINEALIPHLNPRIQRQDTVAFMIQVEGRYVLAAYTGGELVFASYTSPGNPNHHDGHGEDTPSGSWSAQRDNQFSDMYWISGAEASVRVSGGRYISDVMPYAVNIEGGIFSHAGAVNGEKRSHGCVRLPLYYARELYLLYEQSGGQMAWEI